MENKIEKKEINIQLNINLDDANLIFKALGTLPFSEVYELIGKLNEQANQQLQNNQINQK